MEGTPLARLLDEFHQHRLGQEIEDAQYVRAEVEFFDDVVSGVVAREDEIDALLSERLAAGWRIERLDKTLLQILRAGTYELIARPDIPVSTTINEYLDVAHAFFEAGEAKVVNGVLDAVAKAVR
jgi:N utilization substance protein B